MKISILAGAASQTVNVFIRNSGSSTGAGLTGLVFNSAGLTAYYALPKAAAVQITLATLAAVTSSYSSGGFKEIDATNMPGWYRFDIPDAALASGRYVDIHFQGAASMAPCPVEIELTAWNNQDAVRGGLSAMPNAAAGASGGLPLSADSSGRVDVLKVAGTTQTARDLGASVLLSSGTGTGQLDFTSGVVKSNLAQILGTALTETSGYLAAGFKKFFNIAVPVMTVAGVDQTGDGYAGTATLLSRVPGTVEPQTGDSYARLGAPAGASVSADIAAVQAKTVNLPASPAAVGSAMTLTSGERTSIADAALARSLAAESYASDGAVPTLSQILYMIWSAIADVSVAGVTLTTRKLDGSTAAMTFTLNDSVEPTSVTRAT